MLCLKYVHLTNKKLQKKRRVFWFLFENSFRNLVFLYVDVHLPTILYLSLKWIYKVFWKFFQSSLKVLETSNKYILKLTSTVTKTVNRRSSSLPPPKVNHLLNGNPGLICMVRAEDVTYKWLPMSQSSEVKIVSKRRKSIGERRLQNGLSTFEF